ncbi:uncharacterized protein LOC135944005 [Cloeon dipterum]|uniref:uncharacterized protein LOC135944005 n=1 Tax=Cloeon dipterum TaxID=197152 RepID=UPI00321FC7EF
MNFLLTLLLLNTAFSWSSCVSVEFEDMSVDHWELLIGASSKELHYDFCKYNATSNGKQCKSFPKIASIDIREACKCSVEYNKTEAGSFTFSVICNSNSSWCPKNLILQYQQGSIEKPSAAKEISGTSIILVLSLTANVCLIIGGVFVKYRYRVHSYCTEKWRQYVNSSPNEQNHEAAEEAVAFQSASLSFVQPPHT